MRTRLVVVMGLMMMTLSCSMWERMPAGPGDSAPGESEDYPAESSEVEPMEDTSSGEEELPATRTKTPEENRIADEPSGRPLKLVFVHHSSGENWLTDENGGLGIALMENNYFVSDTNYGWGPYEESLGGAIGDFTDTGHWWSWFLGPQSGDILDALYAESGQNAWYARLEEDPGGENEIILFKSCFPNSALDGNAGDSPSAGPNPLRGFDAYSGFHTVANAKAIYLELRSFFALRPEKLFVVITAPPLLASETTPAQAANARAFNRWLVEEWLNGYPHANVAVFDFYNVLTSNGGNPGTNDLESPGGNHHRYQDGQLQYITNQGGDTSAYAEYGDSHPTAAGNRKAAGEFLPLLNYIVGRWKSG